VVLPKTQSKQLNDISLTFRQIPAISFTIVNNPLTLQNYPESGHP